MHFDAVSIYSMVTGSKVSNLVLKSGNLNIE